MIGWAFKIIEDRVNFPLSCPYKPGIHQIQNATMSFPAEIMRIFKGYYCFRVTVDARTPALKKFEKAFEFMGKVRIIEWKLRIT